MVRIVSPAGLNALRLQVISRRIRSVDTLCRYGGEEFAVIIGGAFYLFLVSWNIDVTSWIASAGVVGIAVGFAARDYHIKKRPGSFLPGRLQRVFSWTSCA